MKIKAIALNTFKEAIRDRILYLLLFFAVALIAFSRFLALLTVGNQVKVIKDVGLASLSLLGVLMAILMGTGLVYKEIDKKTIYTLLSKPIHRYQFLLGKFFGLILTLFIMLLVMSLIFSGLVFFHTFSIPWEIFIALAFIFLEMCVITSVAIFFSTFSTPILSSIFSFSFYLIGHFSWSLKAILKKMEPGAGKIMVRVLYTFLPDLENFNFKTEVVHQLPLSPQVFLYSTAYGIFYTVFILFLAILIFKKRDFI